ncbi:MAG: serpin family protein, partial [Bacteroidales bacterium]|nr:serpin family protein [Bacteroidales bacterium]
VLISMGINEAFSSHADFSNMTDAPVCVDQVKQKTFIEVSEEGTEAAAVTSIGVRLTSVRPVEQSPVIMTVDHPFVFAIVDADNDDILFMGNIRNLK